MIVWATEFPIPSSTNPDAILSLATTWLKGSPHLPFRNIDFPMVGEGETGAVDSNGHTVRLSRIGTEDNWWVGCRHAWNELSHREWTTEIVACGSPSGARIGVRLDCNMLAVGLDLPRPKKPYVLKLLLETLGGGADSWLTVDDEPTYLNESQVGDAAAVIEATTSVALPIVYVSAGADHRPFVNPRRLAQWLAGMAHVIVEPSRHFSFALARNTNRRNPYAGAVAILWPRGAERQSRLLPEDFESPEEMAEKCADIVRQALASVRPSPDLTWAYTQELLARRRVEVLRRAGSTELQQYVDAFDEEIRAKDRRIEDAEREIGRLSAENRRLEAFGEAADELFANTNEPEYYPGEMRDAVLYALGLAVTSLESDGRRWHIVQDVLATVKGSGTDVEMAEEVKKCFASSGDLTGSSRRTLENLGFEILDDGRHFRALYQGDGRYAFTISKSSSDHRAGKNLASQINRTLFR